LLTQAIGINNTTIELQTTNTNFAIAMKWTRNYTSHITQVIHIQDLEYVFQQTPDNTMDTEIWQPPIQLDINLFKFTPSTIPKTIIGGPRSSKETFNTSKNNDTDNQTTVTTNTAWSSSDNGISDLQSNYRNQLSIARENRMKQLELLLQTSIADNQEHQSNVAYKIQQVENPMNLCNKKWKL
jgi:hypothetical protein